MKMTEYRSQQPLSDDDFASIRRNVISAIAEQKERRFLPMMLQFALAASVVIAVASILFAHRPAPPVSITTRQLSNPATQQPQIQPQVQQPQLTAPVTVVRVTHRPRRHQTAPHIELVQQNIRVEFRTSDPDVRIIWIASQTPTPTGGKS